MGPGVLVYAIRALEDATKNIIEKEKINKVEDRIKKCAIAASVAGVGSGMLPGVGSIIATTACAAAIWSMYVLINKDLGISIKNNVLKSLASAFLTNIIASAGSFILGKVAGFLLSFLPGFGTAGAIVVEGMIGYVVVFASGVLYIKFLTKLFKAGKGLDINEGDVKSMVDNVVEESNIKEIVKEGRKSYKEDKKSGKLKEGE